MARRKLTAEEVLASLTPAQRAAITRAQTKALTAARAEGRAARPARVSHGAAVERPLRPGGAPIRFPNRDAFERFKAFQRAYRSDARHLSMAQMTTLAARAAAMGLTSRELWWQMFGS